MKGSIRKRILCLSSLVVLSLSVAAQQEYFIFFQSENSQPFYAKIGDKVYSASAIGHLVIPSLKDSTYTISIGFPKNQFPEIDFVITIARKDHGFQLKNIQDQGWVLFNVVTLQLLKPKVIAVGKYQPIDLKKKTDGYSVLMAGIVNDTSVLYNTSTSYPAEPPVVVSPQDSNRNGIKDTIFSLYHSDTGVAFNRVVSNSTVESIRKDSKVVDAQAKKEEEPILPDTVKGNPVAKDSPTLAKTVTPKSDSVIIVPAGVPASRDTTFVKASVSPMKIADIVKIQDEVKDSMREIEFLISEKNVKDTIRISISLEPVVAVPKPPDSANKRISAELKIEPRSDSPAVKKVVMVNSDCRNFANEHDVDKLRVKILAEKTDQEKIAAARKFYKNKCFTARQIKALSELFYLEQAKFEFLAASYPFVSDSENYRQLENLFSDQSYVDKFRNLFPD